MQEMQETRVRSLGREGPLEEGIATHSSILSWRILMDRGAWGAIVNEVAKSQTQLSNIHFHSNMGEGYVLLQASLGAQW